jgi:gluconate kinase
LLCRGESLGAKHPLARDAIEAYLNATAGTSGGPLTPEQRAAWVKAYREVAAAAEAAR